MGIKSPKTASCHRRSGPPNTRYLAPPHSPPQITAQLLHKFLHSNKQNSPLVTIGCPIFILKIAPSRGQSAPPSMVHILGSIRSITVPQTVSRSSQPFFHNHQTSRPTYRLTDRKIEGKSYRKRELK